MLESREKEESRVDYDEQSRDDWSTIWTLKNITKCLIIKNIASLLSNVHIILIFSRSHKSSTSKSFTTLRLIPTVKKKKEKWKFLIDI